LTEAPPPEKKKSRRGFAGMSRELHEAIASKGGKSAHAQGKAHRFTEEQARAAGTSGRLGAAAKMRRNREVQP
jgi:hypothetical protein